MCNIVFCGSLFSVAFLVSWVAFFIGKKGLFSFTGQTMDGLNSKFGIVFVNGCDTKNEFLVLSDPDFMFMTPYALS